MIILKHSQRFYQMNSNDAFGLKIHINSGRDHGQRILICF